MKVKLATIYASPHLTAQPGSVIDVSDEEGKQLVAGRFGIEVPAAPEAEKATVAVPENAARRIGRGKARTPTAAPEVPAAPEAEKKE